MTVPRVKVYKQDGRTGVVKPSGKGILAIIAPAAIGVANVASAHAKPSAAYAEFGDGPLCELAAYTMAETGNPVVLIKGTASTAGTVSASTIVGGGTSTFTDSSSTPLDDFALLITFLTGGTRGVAGVTYKYSLDGGRTSSGTIALGTDVSIAIPNTGITIAIGAGTMLAGQTVAFAIKGPRMTNGDVGTALEALRVYGGSWGAVYVHADSDSTIAGTLSAWLIAREQEGRFKAGFVNGRSRTKATETEAQFATAMDTAWSAFSSTRLSVGGDYCRLLMPLRKVWQDRPAQWPVVARTMASTLSTMASYIADGPLTNVEITDSKKNPDWHDEATYPNLDPLRLTVLRTMDQKEGVYCNLPRLISPSGSDYVFVPHLLVLNEACAIAYQILSNELSRGILKDKATAKILEVEALYLEGLVQTRFEGELVTPRHCTAATFTVSRTDDLSANDGSTLTCDIAVNGLSYVVAFDVSAGFAKAA